jgi:hypothetical protein
MMSDPRGRVRVETEDAIYHLEFTPNGLCAFEAIDPEGRGIFEALAPFLEVAELNADTDVLKERKALKALKSLRNTDLRALFWAGLQEHHEADILTPKDAGKVMHAANAKGQDQGVAMALCFEAIMQAFPDAKPDGSEASADEVAGSEGKVKAAV